MKAIKSNTTSRRQIMISIVLLILIIGLGAGFFVVRTQLDIRDQAAGPVCQSWNLRCSWNNVPGVTNYRVVVRDAAGNTIANTTTPGTSLDFNGKAGVTYTCTVTSLSHTNPVCNDLPSGSGTGFCPLDTSVQITEPVPSNTSSVSPPPSATVTPPAGGTPTVTPGPGTPIVISLTPTLTPTPKAGTPTIPPNTPTVTPTPKAGTPTIQPFTPTPTTIQIGGTGVTTAPSPLPTSGQVVATSAVANPTTITSLPESGIFTPTIFVLIIGVIAILLPLVF